MRSEVAAAWRDEATSFTRAFSGAALFGVPLLFTMEMWWIGTYVDLGKLVGFLGLTFLANLYFAYVVGFKRHTNFLSSVDEAFDALAVGVVAATVILLALDRISLDEPLESILGKIIVQTIPLSIGALAANAIFGRGSRQGESKPGEGHSFLYQTLNDIGATIAGAVFVGFTIAPTEEVVMLASQLDIWHQLGVIGLTLLVTYMIVFASGFDPQQPRSAAYFQTPLTETVLAYVVSLALAFVVLYFFGAFTLSDPVLHILGQVFVLAMPAAVGGAAGRLAI